MASDMTPPTESHLKHLFRRTGAKNLQGDVFKVAVTPVEGAVKGWCTENVKSYIEAHGGEPFYCYDISIISNRFIELEGHVIVLLSDGRFIDPTPHPLGWKEVTLVQAKQPFDECVPPNQLFALKSSNAQDEIAAQYHSMAYEIYVTIMQPGKMVEISHAEVVGLANEYAERSS